MVQTYHHGGTTFTSRIKTGLSGNLPFHRIGRQGEEAFGRPFPLYFWKSRTGNGLEVLQNK